MRFVQLAGCALVVALLGRAEAQSKPQSQEQPQKSQQSTDQLGPGEGGPAVDEVKLTGSTVESVFFKFTYELPKGWKTLDDAVRMKANRDAMAEDLAEGVPSTASFPQVPPRPPSSTKPKAKGTEATQASKVSQVPKVTYERYSLLVASPAGVNSLGSQVLPRINIWAHRRNPAMDDIADHARFLVSTKGTKITVAPEVFVINGRNFEHAEVVNPLGVYRSQWVTAAGDYLVGFEIQAESQDNLDRLVPTMRSVKFRETQAAQTGK